MAYEQKPNTGSVFKNDRKEKDSHPDIKGSALVDGVEYWISGWRKEGERGGWYSLAFTPKDDKPAKHAPKKPSFDDADQDIPF